MRRASPGAAGPHSRCSNSTAGSRLNSMGSLGLGQHGETVYLCTAYIPCPVFRVQTLTCRGCWVYCINLVARLAIDPTRCATRLTAEQSDKVDQNGGAAPAGETVYIALKCLHTQDLHASRHCQQRPSPRTRLTELLRRAVEGVREPGPWRSRRSRSTYTPLIFVSEHELPGCVRK